MSRPASKRPVHRHRPPRDCPVCGEVLTVTRVGCAACGSELAGEFASCEFCHLSDAELDLLRVFLSSRGNLREVEKHLGVSYPTARLRLTALLTTLGLAGEGPEAGVSRDQILADVAAGTLSPEEAAPLLADWGP